MGAVWAKSQIPAETVQALSKETFTAASLEAMKIYAHAQDLVKAGKEDEAIKEYQKALEIKSDYARGYFNIGNLYCQKGNLDEAIASFQKALEIYPKYGEAHYHLALIYFENQKLDLAIQHTDEAARLGIVVDPTVLMRLKPYR